LVGLHGFERLCESCVAAECDVFVDVGGVELAVVAQDESRLVFVEGDFGFFGDLVSLGVGEDEPVDDLVVLDGLCDDGGGVFGFDL
jgi:hypothetical protein